ncbi:MAG: hypothetical protein QGH33_10325 [Pirellulaceae bacterium]|jgi:hypothetical protein|nr:hypothetical protein [Pirellulaceae bacterium]HJN11782.1 hypothetical protein [Pirellulaceae bacterium]
MKLDEAVAIDEGVRQFVQWALETLKVSVASSDRDELTFDIPDRHRAFFRGAKIAQLVYGGCPRPSENSPPVQVADKDQAHPTDTTLVPVDGQFLAWLMEQLSCADSVPYAVSTVPALRVHEISARLFKAYTVDGGTLHLSGCTLEDRPLLRQTWLVSGDSNQPRLVHRFTDSQGVILEEVEVVSLGLTSYQPPAGSLPLLVKHDVRAWCAVAQEQLAATGDAIPDRAAVVASVFWCQYAAGKIEFVIEDVSAEVAFSGWARQLVAGLVDPPAFQCPVTGIQSHAIAATDDGRIAAREAIQVCAMSGRRVLISELKACEQTDQDVLPEYLVTCPVSGQQILGSALELCSTCQQPVSPACLEKEICEACRTMIPIRKDDPRMARVLGEYPRLDRWTKWQIGETSTSYVLVAAAFIKRVLVVIDKENLEMVRLATRNRFSSQWSEPPLTDRQELLR